MGTSESTIRRATGWRSLKFGVTLAACAAVWLLPVHLRAQTTAAGTIRGRVSDATGSIVDGVNVSAHSPHVGGTFTAVTDKEGDYLIVDLPPAEDYAVVAEKQGFSKLEQLNIVVRAGSNTTADLTLQVGTVSQTVEVSANAMLIDQVSSEQAVDISGQLLRDIPLTGRREWSDVLQLTPGVISASSDAYGGQTYFVRGSENENMATLLDGADIGSFLQNWPSNYISISTESLGDVQIKTGAMDASSPAAMGMVINLATPTGGDQFHGAAALLISPLAWNSNNTPGGSSAVSQALQPDFNFSGPIKKQKAWFFVSGRYINRNDGISRTAAQLADLTALDPGYKEFNNQARGFVYVANATVDLTEKHKLFGLVQYDSRTQGANYQWYAGNYAPSQYGGGAYALRLTDLWSARLVTRFLVSYNNKGANTSLGAIGGNGTVPETDVYSNVVASGGALVGSGLLATLGDLSSRTLEPSHKATISGDLSYLLPGYKGSHELATGFYLQPRSAAKETTFYSDGGYDLVSEVLVNPNNPADGVIPFQKQYVGATDQLTTYTGANDYAWYVQDRWRPYSRLTITGGLRADYISGEDLLFHVTTEKAWNWAPRVGGAYELTKNGKNVIRANWAHITDIPNAAYFGTAGTASPSVTNEYSLGLNGDFNTVFNTPSQSAASANEFAPHRHQGYVVEWLAGYRTQLPGNVVLDVSYVDREYKDRPAYVDINNIYVNDVWQGLADPAVNTRYLITNNTWNWFVYQGAEVTATKQLSKLQLISTFTRSWDHIAGTWEPNDPAGILQPDAFADNTGIGSVRGFEANSLASGSADTRNRMWQKYQFRTGATWAAPWHLRISSSITAQSGTPTGPITTNIAAADPAYGPTTMEIDGRLVSNPLATTYRFAFANRGDGQLYCPWLTAWDNRIGRDFPIKERQTIQVAFDIFNITNQGAAQQFVTGGNQINSKNFGLTDNVQLPRSAQVSVRYRF
jgi:hypothetical protein